MSAQWPAPQVPQPAVRPQKRRFYAGWTRKTWALFIAGCAAVAVLFGPAYVALWQIIAKY